MLGPLNPHPLVGQEYKTLEGKGYLKPTNLLSYLLIIKKLDLISHCTEFSLSVVRHSSNQNWMTKSLQLTCKSVDP